MTLHHHRRRPRVPFEQADSSVRHSHADQLGQLGLCVVGVADDARQRQDVKVHVVPGEHSRRVTSALRDHARRRSKCRPSCVAVGVQHLSDLGDRNLGLAPCDVVLEAGEDQRTSPETVRGCDDPAPLGIVRSVAEVRVAGKGEGPRQVRRLRRIADQVGLKRRRLDLGLQPGQDHLIVGNRPKVLHYSHQG